MCCGEMAAWDGTKTEKYHTVETKTAVVKMTGAVLTESSLFESDDEDAGPMNSRLENGTVSPNVVRGSNENRFFLNKQTTNSPVLNGLPPNCDKPDREPTDKLTSLSNLNKGKALPDVNDNKDDSANYSLSPSSPLSGTSTSSASPKKQTRFNPFNRELDIDDEHFEILTDNYFIPSLQVDQTNSTRSESFNSRTTSDSDDITFADLGLAEDHFSHPEGYFGLSNVEELQQAVATCKELIKDTKPDSDKHKNLVKKLIHLRLKIQEIKDGPDVAEPDIKLVTGHKFKMKQSRSSKHYCEKCNGVIWGVLQEWYRCKDCGYCCHAKCLNQITRTCARLKVDENPTYILSICPMKCLASQNYRCFECRKPISYLSNSTTPRLCDYSGQYYCDYCHWNDNMVIPARVLHNWDFEMRKVSRSSKQFLKLMYQKAAIRIQDINPMLFNFVDELNEIKKLREELLIMKKYILLCPQAMETKLLRQLSGRQHFVESSDVYSMKDLMEVQSDVLLSEIAQVHSSWAQHIKTDCQRCQGRGYVCELCNEKEVLFPFDNIAVVCAQCSNVLHRHCFAREENCPKCKRREKRKEE